ncbi:MAG: type IV pilus secretin PilQ [Comamonadaceae bacterium]|nr:type IV pilus secretin PilQ [Comamonadaceae bacterium]
MGVLLTSAMAHAQIAIEAVSGSVQSGVEVVRIDLSQALTALPTGFSIQSPARIALDFPNVVSAMGRSNVDVNQGNLKSVSVVQAGNRTRVVLNLKQSTAYKTQIQDKSLLIVLESVAGVAPAAVTQVFAENQSRDTQPLRDLEFRRGEENAGRVVVTLPNNQVGVDIRQQGQTLVVEFMKTTLPEGLRRRLDVTDFGTPVKSVVTYQVGDRVRMVIEPQGLWAHSAYQSDSQFVVEVKPVKVDPSKLTQGPGYTGQKLSLNFQNIEVRSLLQVIADFTSFNIITSDTVNGAVTLRLQDVPWDQALDIILQAKGLGMRKTDNVIWIAPKEEIAAKEKQELESKATVLSLEPVKMQTFQLSYASAVDIVKQLNESVGGDRNAVRTLSSRGTAAADLRTNQLFVTDVPSKLEQVQQLIAKLDIPVKQVLIEARMVEASDTFGKSLGVKLGATDLRAQQGGDGGYSIGGGNRVAIGTSYANSVASSGAGGSVDTSGNFVNLPAIGSGAYAPATFALAIFSSAANRFLNLEISALESDGKGQVISSPRVVTADMKEAIIETGTEVSVATGKDDKGNPIIEKVKGVLGLRVTPRIMPDGSINMAVHVNKDTIISRSPIEKSVKSVQTDILVENGGTVVIGGIYESAETDSLTKVPFLGDLPGVGNLFKSKSRFTEKKELLIFITPKVVADKAPR